MAQYARFASLRYPLFRTRFLSASSIPSRTMSWILRRSLKAGYSAVQRAWDIELIFPIKDPGLSGKM
jgi:hypothetical protein